MKKRLHIMPRSTIVIILCSCFCIGAVKSQIPAPQFIPPSPNAYSLGKYGEMPVGTYSGIPDITIPLIPLSQNELSVDVSLSYNGGGIKVDEIASWVGLGWSLNAGGIITRVVRGRPEYLLSNGEHRPIRRSLNFFSLPGDRTDYIAASELDALAGGSLDGEPDEFYFNFQGRGGKFWFNENGIAMLNKNEALEINWLYVSSDQSMFVIKDESGTSYEFGVIETAWFAEFNQSYPTAWHLTKITSSNGNEILFEYNTPISVTHSIRYQSEYIALLSDNTLHPQTFTDFSLPQTEVFLKKISNRNGWIEFIRSTSQRLDYRTTSPSYALDEIRMYGKDSISIKKFKFYTSYFEANDARKYDGISQANYEHLNYRLRLDSVVEFASDFITKKPATQFYYLGDNDPETDDIYTLPYRLSPAQDHWGYYNNTGNTHIFPAPPPGNLGINSDPIYEYFWRDRDCPGTFSLSNGADRNPDTAAMKACTLNLIKYPTGGAMLYSFEANYDSGVFYSGGLRIKNIINYSSSGTPVQTKYTYGPGIATFNPANYYFTRYCVSYWDGTFPNVDYLQKLGLPTTNPGGDIVEKFLKIRILPQAVLGNGVQFGYSDVTVSQTGNGYSVYSFAEAGEFPDYINNEYIEEGAQSAKLDRLYGAQYITDWPSEYGPDGDDFYKSISFSDFPYLPLYTNDWKRGVLKAKGDFNEDDVLLRLETHDYTRTFLDTIAGVKVIKTSNLPEYIYAKYYVPHASIQKTKDSIVVFDKNGANPVTTTTEYFFDNAVHLQNTRIVTTNSKREKETVYMKYPLDYTLTGTVSDPVAQGVKYLQTNHLVNPMIEKYVQRSEQDDSNLRTTSAVLSTFKTTAPLPDKAYNWEPPQLPGTFTATAIAPGSVTKSSDYKSKLALTNFDAKGNLVERQLQDNVVESFLWDYSYTYPVAKITNAAQTDIAYTSFEADGKGNWTYSGTPAADITAPTGRRAFTIVDSTDKITKTGLSVSKTYIVSYWKKSGTVSVNSTTPVSGSTVDGWTYYEHKVVNPSGGTIMVSGTNGVIDELRLYPDSAQMTTYTYKPLIGMTSQCDVNNRITYYEYDGFGRLIIVRDQDKKVLKKICYNYAGQPEGCTVYGNIAKSGTFIKACTSCQTGSSVVYTVPEDTYTSGTQTAADQLAQNDVNANGQAYANAQGTCSTPVTGTLKGTNQISLKNFTISLVNINTYCSTTPYIYTLNGGTTNVSLGNLPSGNYNITVTPVGGTVFYTCTINGVSLDGSSSVSFSSQSVSNGTLITITPIL